jgi:hypothetical protein
MDGLIASLSLCFDKQDTNWSEEIPTMAVLPSLAAKHAHGEAHGVLCVPLFWKNSVLATWTICSRKTIENKKPTRRAEDELVEHVCLSRWASWGSSDARRFC